MGAGFKDHFSRQAAAYGDHRPRYPDALFRFLATAAPPQAPVWDCATGSGQAAGALARWFPRVVATDASRRQLAHARAAPGVHYMAATAEACPLATASVGLVTVAQALHWLDLPAFYAEVDRVLMPGGGVAAWSYGLARIAPAVDAVVERLYGEVLGPYWPPERRHVERGYRDLPFPFVTEPAPAFVMTARWDLDHFRGYLASWSAVERCRQAGQDPFEDMGEALLRAWGAPFQRRQVTWPLTVRIGRQGNPPRYPGRP